MQVARPALPLLNIELAQRKPVSLQHQQQQIEIQQQHQQPIQKTDDVSAEATSVVGIDPIPPSPLSPPTFLSKVPAATAASPIDILLLNERYLLLECIEGAVSPQSQPLRRCIDTVTEETHFCRECSTSPATATLLEAHYRLRHSQVVTPIYNVIHAEGDAQTPKLYLLSPASYGDLHSYLRSKRRLKETEARTLFRQAAQAVYDCHRQGVVLTDLKLRRFVFADPQR